MSVGKARVLAGISLWAFRRISAARRIPARYDEADLSEDLKAIKVLARKDP